MTDQAQIANAIENGLNNIAESVSAKNKKTKRGKILKFSAIAAFIIITAGIYLFGLSKVGIVNLPSLSGTPSTGSVGIVRLTGVISSDSESNAEDINTALYKAFKSSKTTAVILLANSGGGSPVQSDSIYTQIIRLKAKYNKPIITVVQDICASGCLYAASATDQIILNKNSIYGSIGVISSSFGLDRFIDKYDIDRRVMVAGANKSQMDMFQPTTDEQLKKMQSLLGVIHTNFIKAVKDGRGERLDIDYPGLFTGDFWLGAQAIEIGLADETGTLISAMEKHFDTNHRIEFNKKKSFKGLFGVNADKLTQQIIKNTLYELNLPAPVLQ